MGGERNHPTVININSWMRDIERRMLTQERRSPGFDIQRILGLGFSRYARQVFDWNGEETWQSGQYWSDTGDTNAPDNDRPWAGYVQSAFGVGGVQTVWSLDGTDLQWFRNFTFTDDGIPTFGAWTFSDPTPLKTLDYATATTTVQSGDAGPKALTGISRVMASRGVTDEFFITLELDWSGAAGSTIAAFRPLVDGATTSLTGGDIVLNTVGGRYLYNKTWKATGLSAGNHTFTATVNWGAGSSLDIVGVTNTTCMIVERRMST